MLRIMLIEDISLKKIDQDNELFRISEELDYTPVFESLRKIGQLNPVILLERNAKKVIVCGFRRVQALRRLGATEIQARILTGETCDPIRAFSLALHENLSHRQLDPLEKARALFSLRTNLHVPDETLVHSYLPLLGLNPHESVLRNYVFIHGMHPVLRDCVKDGRLTHRSIETIAEMTPDVQDGIACLMQKARLSASLQKKVLGLLADVEGNRGSPPGAYLKSPEVSAILNDPSLSPFQKGERVHQILYRIRNPRLSVALDRFATHRESLRLPGSIRIAAHPFFEEPGLHVEFDARDVGHFRSLADALHAAARLPELEKMFII
jgi:hypothetical protein